MNARAERKLSRLDQFHEQSRFALVHLLDEVVNLLFGQRFGEALGFPVMLHALFAARDLEQFMIVVHTPLVSEAEFLKGHIERHTMTIAFSVNNDTVLVEEHCFDI